MIGTSKAISHNLSPLFLSNICSNHHSLCVAGLWKLLHTSLLFMPTFLLRNILTHRRPNDMLALFIILCSKTIAENQYFMHMTNAVVETRNFVSNLLFRKALHLPPGANITVLTSLSTSPLIYAGDWGHPAYSIGWASSWACFVIAAYCMGWPLANIWLLLHALSSARIAHLHRYLYDARYNTPELYAIHRVG